MIINDKEIITISAKESTAPLVLYNTFEGEGREIYDEVKKLTDKDFSFAAISKVDWEREMTPWPAKAIYKNNPDFKGEADKYIRFLTEQAIPEIKKENNLNPDKIYLAGYSLGGLFAVYSLYKTDIFSGVASASGSMWYQGFMEYVIQNHPIKKPERIYLSVGDREAVTRNESLKKVEENTRTLYEHFKESNIDSFYELNEGNHFKDAAWRMAKGIAYLLK